MCNNYEITSIKIFYFGRELHRIKALKDIYIKGKLVAKKGEEGAWVHNKSNLSQESAWASWQVMLLDKASVKNNSFVTGVSIIRDCAIVDNSTVRSAKIQGTTIIKNSIVTSKCVIQGLTKIQNSKINRESKISGKNIISDAIIPFGVTIKNCNIQSSKDYFCSMLPPYQHHIIKEKEASTLFYKNRNNEINYASEFLAGSISVNTVKNTMIADILLKNTSNDYAHKIIDLLVENNDIFKEAIIAETKRLISYISTNFPCFLGTIYDNYDVLYEAQMVLLLKGILNDTENNLIKRLLDISEVDLKTNKIVAISDFCCLSETLLLYITNYQSLSYKSILKESLKTFNGNILEF